jgi:MOSC domain-containing protein YiiM
MKLLSVNVGQPVEIEYAGDLVETGIYKSPVDGPVMLHALNLDGDKQADPTVHGGVDQAVYVYSVENYAYWEGELEREIPYGQFGENFTVEGMTDDSVYVSDIYRIGDVTVQVTMPRAPCFKLGHKMGSQTFVKQFMRANRPGFYLRVLEEGMVEAGVEIERIKIGAERVAITEVMGAIYLEENTAEVAERAFRVPDISPKLRATFEYRLSKAVGD